MSYPETTLLSRLEQALYKADSCFNIFYDLAEQAAEMGHSPSHCFMINVYSTFISGAKNWNIALELRRIALEQNILNGKAANPEFTVELRNTCQSLSTDKNAFFLNRLEVLYSNIVTFCSRLTEIEEATKQFNKQLPEIIKKATPESLSQLADMNIPYNSQLPKTLHATKNVLWWLPRFNSYFLLQGIELRSLLIEFCLPRVSSTKSEFTTFEDLLSDNHKKDLMPKLLERYRNAKPRIITCMVFALSDLGIIPKRALEQITQLHKALTATFNDIGSRTALNEAINRYKTPSRAQNDEMQKHKRFIQDIKVG